MFSIVDTGTTSSVRISQMQSQSTGQGIDELRHGQVDLKTIEDVWGLTEVCSPWIAGTIVLVNFGKSGWCYKACPVCPKKVEPKENDMYKIEIVAYDDTTTITLLLWDNEVADLIGIKAQTLKDAMGDKDAYPAVIDELFERQLLFKITVQSKNISGEDSVFRVMKICEDEETVERYYPKDEALDNKSENNPAEIGGSNEVDFPANVISLQNDTDSQLNVDNLDRSVTSMKAKTPAKLVADGDGIVTRGKKIRNDEGQLSTNKFSRKMPKKSRVQSLEGEY
ncbi:hypothetical protein PIB30_035563 [Stylosanthes scabra]|uniref:Replication factor A C-terminal domain-containing protein n=1 Tax=Stylosanthes scabra TaxID=79078 RepID=A0ABU6TE80_9FABA|nr:hypothetical protein [Stylosanthes scabra]